MGINSDEMVGQMKGPSRPVYPIDDRVLLISSMRVVDDVVVFTSQNELDHVIFSIRPDILVVGSDYKNCDVVGEQHAGSVVYFDRITNISTTKIISKIKVLIIL